MRELMPALVSVDVLVRPYVTITVPNSEPKAVDNLSVGMIAGIVAGVFAGLCLCGVCISCIRPTTQSQYQGPKKQYQLYTQIPRQNISYLTQQIYPSQIYHPSQIYYPNQQPFGCQNI
jgi:hypothetical protein